MTTQAHPSWCEQTHPNTPQHAGQIGDDVEITSAVSFAVYVARGGDKPAEVQLLEHTAELTTVTGMSILQASILRDLLTEALTVLAGEASR